MEEFIKRIYPSIGIDILLLVDQINLLAKILR